MSSLDDAMLAHITYIVQSENRPFSYVDFLSFDVHGEQYKMTHGTIRNKLSRLKKRGQIELSYYSLCAFYTLKGHKFGKPMTPDHTVVHIDPVYNMIQNLPTDKQSIHDIHLKFKAPNIYKIFSDNTPYPIIENNKSINFEEYRNIEFLIETGFFTENDPCQKIDEFYCAHWYMSAFTLEMLSNAISTLPNSLLEFYKIYKDSNASLYDRKFNFNQFVRTWHDIYGYKINIQNTIYQYCDLFVRAVNEIDPTRNETPYYAAKSDHSVEGLIAAVKELILLGNRGRVEGFALLRSVIEIHLTRSLFNLNDIPKYNGKKVVAATKYLPSVNAICRSIERLKLDSEFHTDIVKRVYDWGSIISHRGFRTDEYITWFIRDVIIQICGLFTVNLAKHKEKILNDLITSGQIKIISK